MNGIGPGIAHILVSFVAFMTWPFVAYAQVEPGSTVDFGDQIVDTRSEERLVVRIRYVPGFPFAVEVDVIGEDFVPGAESTCLSSPKVLTKDCYMTIAFAPRSEGVKTGTILATYYLCSSCQVQEWYLTGKAMSFPSDFSPCDVDRDHQFTVNDVQLVVNQALGIAPLESDLDGDGAVTVVEVQRVVNTVLGRPCLTGK